MFRGTAENDLLHFSKSQTNGWEKATTVLGNQPGGYKVSEVIFCFSAVRRHTLVI